MVNDRLFEEAIEIAHGDFVLAVCPSVLRKSKEVINRREHYDNFPDRIQLAKYVSVICKCAKDAEIEACNKDN